MQGAEVLCFVLAGINPSNDKVLQSRVFSYSDTQRYRIGVNYQMLPINAPKCPFHLNNNDGAMNFAIKDEEVGFFGFRIQMLYNKSSAKHNAMPLTRLTQVTVCFFIKLLYKSKPSQAGVVIECLLCSGDSPEFHVL